VGMAGAVLSIWNPEPALHEPKLPALLAARIQTAYWPGLSGLVGVSDVVFTVWRMTWLCVELSIQTSYCMASVLAFQVKVGVGLATVPVGAISVGPAGAVMLKLNPALHPPSGLGPLYACTQ